MYKNTFISRGSIDPYFMDMDDNAYILFWRDNIDTQLKIHIYAKNGINLYKQVIHCGITDGKVNLIGMSQQILLPTNTAIQLLHAIDEDIESITNLSLIENKIFVLDKDILISGNGDIMYHGVSNNKYFIRLIGHKNYSYCLKDAITVEFPGFYKDSGLEIDNKYVAILTLGEVVANGILILIKDSVDNQDVPAASFYAWW